MCMFFVSLRHMLEPVNRLSVIFLETCPLSFVPRLCSFLILLLSGTPHIHRSILISTTVFLVARFVVTHVSAHGIAGLLAWSRPPKHWVLRSSAVRFLFSWTVYVSPGLCETSNGTWAPLIIWNRDITLWLVDHN